MRILVVKLSSMGDVVHLLPALTDLQQQVPDVRVDWVVEEGFSEIPRWHPCVQRVFAVATRRWRKGLWRNRQEIKQALGDLRQQSYDLIIDAQGLLKSSLISRIARLNRNGRRVGFGGASLREPLAKIFYDATIEVDASSHALLRLRQLFATIFGYTFYGHEVDSQIDSQANSERGYGDNFLVFLHATTWPTKHLPIQTWRDLVGMASQQGRLVLLPWGNNDEKRRAEQIAQGFDAAIVLPKMTLTLLRNLIGAAKGVIAVDTGLLHLTAALQIPSVSLYGSTNAKRTGAVGKYQKTMQSSEHCSPCLARQCKRDEATSLNYPCYKQFSAVEIMQELELVMQSATIEN